MRKGSRCRYRYRCLVFRPLLSQRPNWSAMCPVFKLLGSGSSRGRESEAGERVTCKAAPKHVISEWTTFSSISNSIPLFLAWRRSVPQNRDRNPTHLFHLNICEQALGRRAALSSACYTSLFSRLSFSSLKRLSKIEREYRHGTWGSSVFRWSSETKLVCFPLSILLVRHNSIQFRSSSSPQLLYI